MKALELSLVFRLGTTGEQKFIYKKFYSLQLPCYAINWHGIVHACTSINDLYTCQVSDVSVVKQASSSGWNLS